MGGICSLPTGVPVFEFESMDLLVDAASSILDDTSELKENSPSKNIRAWWIREFFDSSIDQIFYNDNLFHALLVDHGFEPTLKRSDFKKAKRKFSKRPRKFSQTILAKEKESLESIRKSFRRESSSEIFQVGEPVIVRDDNRKFLKIGYILEHEIPTNRLLIQYCAQNGTKSNRSEWIRDDRICRVKDQRNIQQIGLVVELEDISTEIHSHDLSQVVSPSQNSASPVSSSPSTPQEFLPTLIDLVDSMWSQCEGRAAQWLDLYLNQHSEARLPLPPPLASLSTEDAMSILSVQSKKMIIQCFAALFLLGEPTLWGNEIPPLSLASILALRVTQTQDLSLPPAQTAYSYLYHAILILENYKQQQQGIS